MKQRLRPVSYDDLPDALKAPSKWFSPPDSGGGETAPSAPQLANVQLVMARNPALARGWKGFVDYLLNETALDLRTRELLILRTSVKGRFDYEWGQHVAMARKVAGFTDEDFEKILAGPDDPRWASEEQPLIAAVDELVDDFEISDGTWTKLASRFDDKQMMDIVFTVGNYTMLGFACRSFGIELDPGLNPIPDF